MKWVKVIIGTVRTLMVLGIVEFVAPGFSHDITENLVNLMFEKAGK